MANREPQFWTVVPAAGSGSRMQADLPKQYLSLSNKKVIDYTLDRLTTFTPIQKVVVAIAPNDSYWSSLNWSQHVKIETVTGGSTRAQSVLNGLSTLLTFAHEDDWVLVHDAARPCITHNDLHLLVSELKGDEVGGLLGMPVRDTMKLTDDQRVIMHTQSRVNMWHAFTPQMFRLKKLYDALKAAQESCVIVTDEAQAMEVQGCKPRMINGRVDNIKITVQSDIQLAQFYLQQQTLEGIN